MNFQINTDWITEKNQILCESGIVITSRHYFPKTEGKVFGDMIVSRGSHEAGFKIRGIKVDESNYLPIHGFWVLSRKGTPRRDGQLFAIKRQANRKPQHDGLQWRHWGTVGEPVVSVTGHEPPEESAWRMAQLYTGDSGLPVFDSEGYVVGISRSFSTMNYIVGHFLAGDCNMDGKVGIGDLAMFAKNFRRKRTGWTGGDFNGNGVTDIGDLAMLARNFGSKMEIGNERN